ncbi:hypothetical protein MKW98_029327 [Papaver atlanticum]|uniref:3'-5' exonuclease domain-containing protein n=1 Tax=Papaver atlanticum TaxID=357466 RepID=A0AAD4SI93_9MAGN|nr:hypothetical protein MKW98_029327 [Papaver atlanticum]
MANTNYNVQFKGETIVTTVTNSSSLIDAVLDEFRSERFIGFAMKWNPNSDNKKVSTLQLCNGNRCIIIQLLHLDSIPNSLRNLLSGRSIKFVGVDIAEDIAKLDHDHGLKCWYGHELGFGVRSLAGVLIKELDSVNDHSDWSANILTKDQIEVAAMEASVYFTYGKVNLCDL